MRTGDSSLTFSSALGTLLACCLLTACIQGESNVAAGNREGIIHVGNGTEPQSLDPHVMSGIPEFNIVRALFEGLVTINPYTLQPEPAAARNWSFSDDGRIVTFQLNPDARWSNGDPVTAQDFAWSWRRALDPGLGNLNTERLFPIKNAEEYATGVITDPEAVGIQALDAHTLELTLNEPTPYLLYLLNDATTYPVHRATIEKFGKPTDRFTRWTRVGNMVSNGPFKLKSWQLNRRIELEKNPTYWNADAVALNGIVFHPIESGVVEERMFRSGGLHYTMDVPLGKIAGYNGMERSPYVQSPSFASYYYLFNIQQAPVDDVRVRRAMAMAIDRERLASTVLENVYLPLYSLIPPGIPGYESPAVLRHDPDRARQLMAEAGYPDGAGWPGLEVIYNTLESHHKIVVALQQMWKEELNIHVTLANMEWRVYLDMVAQKDFQLARAGRQWSYLDPHVALSLFITGGGNNSPAFADERFDRLVLEEAAQAPTGEKRFATYREAERIFLEQMPIIPLFVYTNRHLVHPSVKGIPGNLLDQVNYRHVSLAADGTVPEAAAPASQ
jgi:oligopeptide transport system substrate-binding protein